MTSIADLLRTAWDARRRGRVEEWASLVSEATERARASGSPAELADALHQQAQIHRDSGEPQRALEPYREAIALRRNGGSPTALAHEIRHLADLHLTLGDLEAADARMGDAMELYRAAEAEGCGQGDALPLDVANAVRAAAVLRDAQRRTEEARTLWREAGERYAELGLETGVEEAEARLRD
jgi:tetratricopeptide (TPR) repeat protein